MSRSGPALAVILASGILLPAAQAQPPNGPVGEFVAIPDFVEVFPDSDSNETTLRLRWSCSNGELAAGPGDVIKVVLSTTTSSPAHVEWASRELYEPVAGPGNCVDDRLVHDVTIQTRAHIDRSMSYTRKDNVTIWAHLFLSGPGQERPLGQFVAYLNVSPRYWAWPDLRNWGDGEIGIRNPNATGRAMLLFYGGVNGPYELHWAVEAPNPEAIEVDLPSDYRAPDDFPGGQFPGGMMIPVRFSPGYATKQTVVPFNLTVVIRPTLEEPTLARSASLRFLLFVDPDAWYPEDEKSPALAVPGLVLAVAAALFVRARMRR